MYKTKMLLLLNIKLLPHNCNYIQCRSTCIMKRKIETLALKKESIDRIQSVEVCRKISD